MDTPISADSVESFLQAQAGALPADPGEFSIQLERAKEMLSKYQLRDPRSYCLKFVQWAVRSRASTVWVTTTRSSFKLTHDGTEVSPADIEAVRKLSPALSQLSAGVCGALALNPTEIRLTYRGETEELLSAKKLISTEDEIRSGVEILGLKRGFLERSSLLSEDLKLRWQHFDFEGPLQRSILSSAGLGSLEASLVRRFARYSAIPILVNNRLINTPFDSLPMLCRRKQGLYYLIGMAHRHGHFVFFADPATPQNLLAPASELFSGRTTWFSQGQFVTPREIPNANSLLRYKKHPLKAVRICAYYGSRGVQQSHLYLVQDGVVVRSSLQDFDFPVEVTMDVSHLKPTGIGFGVLRNEDYQTTMTWCRTQVREAKSALLATN